MDTDDNATSEELSAEHYSTTDLNLAKNETSPHQQKENKSEIRPVMIWCSKNPADVQVFQPHANTVESSCSGVLKDGLISLEDGSNCLTSVQKKTRSDHVQNNSSFDKLPLAQVQEEIMTEIKQEPELTFDSFVSSPKATENIEPRNNDIELLEEIKSEEISDDNMPTIIEEKTEERVCRSIVDEETSSQASPGRDSIACQNVSETGHIPKGDRECYFDIECYDVTAEQAEELSEMRLSDDGTSDQDSVSESTLSKGLLLSRADKQFDSNVPKCSIESCEDTPDSRYIKCQICERSVRSRCALRIHMTSHSDERPHACTLCDKKYKVIYALNRHMKLFHRPYWNWKENALKRVKANLKEKNMASHSYERPHACTLCDKKYKVIYALNRHMKLFHRPYGNWKEKVRKENALKRVKSNLKEKNVTYHSDEKPHACTLCDKKYKLKYDLNIHRRLTHRPYWNWKEKKRKEKALKKVKSNLKEKNKTYVEKNCYVELCNKEFSHNYNNKKTHYQCVKRKNIHCKKASMNKSRHRKSYSTVDNKTEMASKPCKCCICNKPFPNTGNLGHHMSTHTDQRLCKCNGCNKTFNSKINLQRHMMITHVELKPLKCSVCGKAFKSSILLKAHVKCHGDKVYLNCHRDENGDTEEYVEESMNSPGPEHHDNEKGNKNNDTNGCRLKNQVRWKKRDVGIKKSKTANRLREQKCLVCSKTFRRQWDMTRHRTGKCTICNKDFKCLSELNTHMKLCHGAGHRSKLSVGPCLSNKTLKSCHDNYSKQNKHTSDKEHVAKSKQTTRNKRMQRVKTKGVLNAFQRSQFVRKEINGKKIFQCLHCEKISERFFNAKRHMTTHHPEKPYRCTLCDKAFKIVYELTRHMKSHHGSSKSSISTNSDLIRENCQTVEIEGTLNPKRLISDNELTELDTSSEQSTSKKTNKKVKKQSENNSLQRSQFVSREINGKRVFQCLLCGKISPTIFYAKRHMTLHHPYKPYRCTLCDKSFKVSYELKKHIRKHLPVDTCLKQSVDLTAWDKAFEAKLSGTAATKQTSVDIFHQKEIGDCPEEDEMVAMKQTSEEVDVTYQKEIGGCLKEDGMAARKQTSEEVDVTYQKEIGDCLKEDGMAAMKQTSEEVDVTYQNEIGDCPEEDGMAVMKPQQTSKEVNVTYQNEIGDCLEEDELSETAAMKQTSDDVDLNHREEIEVCHEEDANSLNSECNRQEINLQNKSEDIGREFSSGSSESEEKKHMCSFCGKKFRTLFNAQRHMILHNSERPYKCTKCDRTFKHIYDLNKHMKTHPGVGYRRPPSGSLKKIVKNVNKGILKISHMESKVESTESQTLLLKCSICESMFHGVFFLKQHLESHDAEGPVKCSICEMTYSNLRELINHLNSHNAFDTDFNEKSTSISDGDLHKSIEQSQQLTNDERERMKNNDEPVLDDSDHESDENVDDHKTRVKCMYCGKSFCNISKLRRHTSKHHDNPAPYSCSKCREKFKILADLNHHLIKCHSQYGAISSTIGKRRNSSLEFKCSICGKQFNRRFGLERHMASHSVENPYQCPLCEKSFKVIYNLNTHMIKNHNEQMEYPCSLCKKTYPHVYGLQIHLDTFHGEKKITYKCPVCQKNFHEITLLNDHMHSHPELKKNFVQKNEERPFLCSECGKTFLRSSDLHLHSLRHKGVKPFKCPHCDKAFLAKHSMKFHVKRLHHRHGKLSLNQLKTIAKKEHLNVCRVDTTELTKNRLSRPDSNVVVHVKTVPFKCAECSKIFNYHSDLKFHLSSVHSAKGSWKKREREVMATNHVQLDGGHGRINDVLVLNEIQSDTDILIFKCCICNDGKEIEGKTNIKKHLWSHCDFGDVSKCKACGKSSTWICNVKRHMMVAHMEMMPMNCLVCLDLLRTLKEYETHMKRHQVPAVKNGSESIVKGNTTTTSGPSPKGNEIVDYLESSDMEQNNMESTELSLTLHRPASENEAVCKEKQIQVESEGGEEGRAGPYKVLVEEYGSVGEIQTGSDDVIYECRICNNGNKFNGKSDIKNHMSSHCDFQKLKCNKCNIMLSSRSSVKRHMLSHAEIIPFKCSLCFKSLKSKTDFEVHMKVHNALNKLRNDEPSSFKEIEINTESREILHSTDENLQLYDQNGNNSGGRPNQKELVSDMETSTLLERCSQWMGEVDDKLYICCICNDGKEFTGKDDMRRHMSCHCDFERFMCKECGNKASNRSNIKRHMMVAHIEMIPDSALIERRNNVTHTLPPQEHEIDEFVDGTNDRESCSTNETPGICDLMPVDDNDSESGCRPTEMEPVGTVETGVNPVIRETQPDDKLYVCCFCKDGIEYKGYDNMMSHMIMHCDFGNLLCKVCGKKQTTRSNLRRHVKMVHTVMVLEDQLEIEANIVEHIRSEKEMRINNTDILYKCCICNDDISFQGKKVMREHMSIHCDNENLRCIECDTMISTNEIDLDKHMMLSHTEIIIDDSENMESYSISKKRKISDSTFYQCGACNDSIKYVGRDNMMYHMMKHGDFVNLTCKICGKISYCRSNLKRHMLSIHCAITI